MKVKVKNHPKPCVIPEPASPKPVPPDSDDFADTSEHD